MKKVSVLFFSLLFLFVFCSCSDATDDYQTPAGAAAQQETEAFIKATGLVLDQDSITLKSGQKKQLKAEVYPSNASDKTLIWRSSDEKVATVQGGTVTAVGNGTTKIIVSAGDELVQTCTVTVSTPAERILVKGSNSGAEVSKLNLEVNTSHKLYATVLPESASEKSVSWESSNQSVATVTNDGVVIAVKNGEADIIAKHVDGISSVCHVVVSTEVAQVSLNVSTLTMELGRKEKLKAEVLPVTANNKALTWRSSNPAVASVDEGTVTALTEGTATITVTSSNGKSATCFVSVKKTVTVTVYLNNDEKYKTIITNSNSQFKIQIPERPEDITTNPSLTRYFAGWFMDSGFNKPLTSSEIFTEDTKIYGKMVPVYIKSFSYTPANGIATITRFNEPKVTTVIVPNYINSFPVAFGPNLFSNNGALKEIVILDGIPGISNSCFADCSSLEKIILPNSIKEIGKNAFSHCARLKEVSLPSGVTKIGEQAFQGCKGLTSIVIPSGVARVEDFCFSGCTGLTQVTLPAGLTHIGYNAFFGCAGITSITIPSGVTSIGNGAFSDCTGLTSINFGGTVNQWKSACRTSYANITIQCSDGAVNART